MKQNKAEKLLAGVLSISLAMGVSVMPAFAAQVQGPPKAEFCRAFFLRRRKWKSIFFHSYNSGTATQKKSGQTVWSLLYRQVQELAYKGQIPGVKKASW